MPYARHSQAIDFPHPPLRTAKVKFWVRYALNVPVSAASATLHDAFTDFHTTARAALSKPCATGGQGHTATTAKPAVAASYSRSRSGSIRVSITQ